MSQSQRCFVAVLGVPVAFLVACHEPPPVAGAAAAVSADAGSLAPTIARPPGGGSTASAPVASSAATETPPSGPALLATVTDLSAWAIDEAYVYWIDRTRGLLRVAKSGGAVASLAAPREPFGKDATMLLAVNGKGVYWASHGGSAPRGLWRTTKEADPAKCETAMFATSDRSDVGALAANAEAVFWVQVHTVKSAGSVWALGGDVRRARAPTETPVTIASINSLNFGALAADDAFVYLLQSGERTHEDHGRVLALPQAGGAVRTIAKTTDFALYAKVDADNVYWSRSDASSDVTMYVRKTGGVEARLAGLCDGMHGLAFDAGSVYMSCSDGTLWRLDRRGGARTKIADGNEPSELAVDSEFIYLASPPRIARIPK